MIVIQRRKKKKNWLLEQMRKTKVASGCSAKHAQYRGTQTQALKGRSTRLKLNDPSSCELDQIACSETISEHRILMFHILFLAADVFLITLIRLEGRSGNRVLAGGGRALVWE